jgi:2-amino-4-hydroxy-6-hydroxymethyldihydropteridine diphosphokinase
VGLGANLGASACVLRRALDALGEHGRIEAVSRFYLSRPYGVTDQPDFVNAVALVELAGWPQEVLATLHELEDRFGRRRTRHWGPRTLDLDLLAYGEWVYRGWELQLPHPEIERRAFVLEPLRDVAPTWVNPNTGRGVEEALAALPESERAALVPLARGYRGAAADPGGSGGR